MPLSEPIPWTRLFEKNNLIRLFFGIVLVSLLFVDYSGGRIEPKVITEATPWDTDDPAIWIHPEDVTKSLILGTDKNKQGGLYVFDLQGKILHDKSIKNLQRPNNVDVEYGFMLSGKPIDIAVVTENKTNKLRMYSLPDMTELSPGGIEVFVGQQHRSPMGLALYKRKSDQAIFAIVSRKTGPTDGHYLWQYQLEDNGLGGLKATFVRSFGKWSGVKEIEAIAVDNELGYVYFSDETVGIRKYYADPQKTSKVLALFGTKEFKRDHEGISIYESGDGVGYILVSNQQANTFEIFPREGSPENPHLHPRIKSVKLSTHRSDGSDVTNVSLKGDFDSGLFVAMSNEKVFHFYAWKDIAQKDLTIKANVGK